MAKAKERRATEVLSTELTRISTAMGIMHQIVSERKRLLQDIALHVSGI